MKREALWHRAEEAAGEQEMLGLTISSRAKYAHGGQPPPCRYQPVPGADTRADKCSARQNRSAPASMGGCEVFGDGAWAVNLLSARR